MIITTERLPFNDLSDKIEEVIEGQDPEDIMNALVNVAGSVVLQCVDTLEEALACADMVTPQLRTFLIENQARIGDFCTCEGGTA